MLTTCDPTVLSDGNYGPAQPDPSSPTIPDNGYPSGPIEPAETQTSTNPPTQTSQGPAASGGWA